MSKPLGTYSFLPWLRQGLANQITAADFDAGGEGPRARCTCSSKLTRRQDRRRHRRRADARARSRCSARATSSASIGARSSASSRATGSRTSSRTTSPHIEFYDEDFPWRYTPAAPDLAKGRLRPWLTLVVLAEGRVHRRARTSRTSPLPYIDVADARSSSRAPTSCGPGRTCTSTAAWPPTTPSSSRRT